MEPDHETGEPALPDWIDELVDVAAAHLAAESELGPLGIRFRQLDSGRWEVVVHPTPVEVVGGASDGAVVSPVFSVDVESLRAEFEQVEGCGLSSHGMFEDEGAFLWIDGVYAGHELTLRLLLAPPDDEAPGSRLDVNRRED
jgi:hypothetical protein